MGYGWNQYIGLIQLIHNFALLTELPFRFLKGSNIIKILCIAPFWNIKHQIRVIHVVQWKSYKEL